MLIVVVALMKYFTGIYRSGGCQEPIARCNKESGVMDLVFFSRGGGLFLDRENVNLQIGCELTSFIQRLEVRE